MDSVFKESLRSVDEVYGTGDDARGESPIESGKRSISAKGAKQVQNLLEIASLAFLFHDPEHQAWAQIEVNSHREIYKVDSPPFSRWLQGRYYDLFDGVPTPQALNSALAVISAKAVHKGEKREVYVRYAFVDGAIYIDLCDSKWRAVRITADGWTVVENHEVMFRRAAKSEALPEPLPGGSLDQVREFLNSELSDREFILLKAWLLGTFMPGGSFVHLDLEGEQGSAKSTTTKVLRSLVDPVRGELLPLSKNEQDLVISALNGRVLSFDNLGRLSQKDSDSFCRLSTGGGFSARKLYSDDDEVVLDVKRPVIFNGIDSIATRADLLDRMIVLTLKAIPEERRCSESDFWQRFKTAHPYILGALFDTVSQALRDRASVNLEKLPRMADFVLWCTAAGGTLEAAGENEQIIPFAEVYEENRAEAAEVALEADVLAQVILDAIATGTYLVGPPTKVCQKLLDSMGGDKPAGFPSPRTLRTRLLRLKPALKARGIKVEISNRSSVGYRIAITKE